MLNFIYVQKTVNKTLAVKLGIRPFSDDNLNSIKISIANINWKNIFELNIDPSKGYDILFAELNSLDCKLKKHELKEQFVLQTKGT